MSRVLSHTTSNPSSGRSTPDSQPKPSYFGSVLDEPGLNSESESESFARDTKRRQTKQLEPAAASMSSSGNNLLLNATAPSRGPSGTHRVVGTVDVSYTQCERELVLIITSVRCSREHPRHRSRRSGRLVGVGCHLSRVRRLLQVSLVLNLHKIASRFLTAFPPFHAATADEIFDNILSRRIDWHEEEVEMSDEARNFIDRLLCFDASQRLGANGAAEVKQHPWLAEIDWTSLRSMEANFVPTVTDPESTDYFDARGATDQVFQDDSETGEAARMQLPGVEAANDEKGKAAALPSAKHGRERAESGGDDFGAFNFKNLDVLKQANDEVIKQLRSNHLLPSDPLPDAAPVDLSQSVSPGSAPVKRASGERVSCEWTASVSGDDADFALQVCTSISVDFHLVVLGVRPVPPERNLHSVHAACLTRPTPIRAGPSNGIVPQRPGDRRRRRWPLSAELVTKSLQSTRVCIAGSHKSQQQCGLHTTAKSLCFGQSRPHTGVVCFISILRSDAPSITNARR